MEHTNAYDFPFPGKFTFVDVEIPNINNNCICAVSMIVVEDQMEVLRHTELINPKTFFSAPNMKIHGISRKDVADARTFSQFWAEYGPYFGGDYIIAAHNSMSDISVMNKDLHRIRKSFEGQRYIDTMDIMTDFYFKGAQRKGDLKLNNIARRLGIYLDHHNPESDVNACYEIVRYMHKYHGLDLDPFIKEIPQKKLKPQPIHHSLTTEQGRMIQARVKRMLAAKDPQVTIKRSLAAAKADKALRHGDYEKAIIFYEAAIARRFNSPGVYLHLSDLYDSIGMLPESLRVLESGIANLARNKGNYFALRRELNRKRKKLPDAPAQPAIPAAEETSVPVPVPQKAPKTAKKKAASSPAAPSKTKTKAKSKSKPKPRPQKQPAQPESGAVSEKKTAKSSSGRKRKYSSKKNRQGSASPTKKSEVPA